MLLLVVVLVVSSPPPPGPAGEALPGWGARSGAPTCGAGRGKVRPSRERGGEGTGGSRGQWHGGGGTGKRPPGGMGRAEPSRAGRARGRGSAGGSLSVPPPQPLCHRQPWGCPPSFPPPPRSPPASLCSRQQRDGAGLCVRPSVCLSAQVLGLPPAPPPAQPKFPIFPALAHTDPRCARSSPRQPARAVKLPRDRGQPSTGPKLSLFPSHISKLPAGPGGNFHSPIRRLLSEFSPLFALLREHVTRTRSYQLRASAACF